jgi:hypothetical protein
LYFPEKGGSVALWMMTISSFGVSLLITNFLRILILILNQFLLSIISRIILTEWFVQYFNQQSLKSYLFNFLFP